MKFAHKLAEAFDTRLLLIATVTVVSGFGVAHWNGLRVAAQSSGELLSGSIGYEIGFSYAVWGVLLVVIAAALITGAATIAKARNYSRLGVQLTITTVIFAAINFVVLVFRSGSI